MYGGQRDENELSPFFPDPTCRSGNADHERMASLHVKCYYVCFVFSFVLTLFVARNAQ